MPNTIVLKFGGSSLADLGLIRKAAELVANAKRECSRVVVVVSAMGDETDGLFNLVHEASARPAQREIAIIASTGELVSSALFAITLTDMGLPSRALSGLQAGIKTSSSHCDARIESIDTALLESMLDEGIVPVVAGFQGCNDQGETTTLGRGGSDTSAAALAVALQASKCLIYTDVPGVFTADPRICPKARILETIYFEEMLELAALGARVLHPRSVEYAGRSKLEMKVLSTLDSTHSGTRIVYELEDGMEKPNVTAIAYSLDEAKITLRNVPDRPGVAATLFSKIAEQNIDVDVIVQNTGISNHTDISFTVHKSQLERALENAAQIAEELGAEKVEKATSVAKVSLVGVGMRGHAGIAASMFAALAEENVNIQMISTSEIKVSVIIEEEKAEHAVRKLHDVFGLEAEMETGAVGRAQA